MFFGTKDNSLFIPEIDAFVPETDAFWINKHYSCSFFYICYVVQNGKDSRTSVVQIGFGP